MLRIQFAQLRFLSLILLSWLAIFIVTRSTLLLMHLPEAEAGLSDLFRIYTTGLVYDLSFLTYAALPLIG